MSREPLGRILVRRGLVTEEQLASLLDHQARSGGMIGESAVRLGYVDESNVLRALAEQHGISYVSRKQVAESPVSRQCLEVVPLEEAQRSLVFPVWYNPAGGELVLIVADPADESAIDTIRRRTKMPVVTTILALPGTIRAAIDKHYRGIADAFERADEEPPAARTPPPPPARAAAPSRAASAEAEWRQDVRRLAQLRQGTRLAATREHVESPTGAVVLLLEPDASRAAAATAFLSAEGYRARVAEGGGQVAERVARDVPAFVVVREPVANAHPEWITEVEALVPAARIRRVPGYGEAVLDEGPRFRQLLDATFETLDVLLRLAVLDGGRGPVGPTLPKLARQVGAKLGLTTAELDELTVAAYMRGLARDELTVPTVLDLEGTVERARVLEEIRIPMKHLVQLGIPVAATGVLAHVYERVDGRGLPDGLTRDEIPLGARIVAVVGSFERAAGGRVPDGKDEVGRALKRLFDARGTVFDPRVLNAFLEVLEKGLLLGEIDVGLPKVALVDPDARFAEALSTALIERGLRVLRAESVARARELARDYELDLVVTEARLPDGDGLALLDELRAAGGGTTAPAVVFVTSDQDQAVMGQALEHGAEDYVLKIVGDKVILAKLERILERLSRERTRQGAGARGVSGRLAEMSLPDIIQVLGSSGKSARIGLAGSDRAGAIWVRAGEIVHAEAGSLEGEEAFYWLIGLTEGEFQIETVSAIERQTIEANYEMLMLEGLRRMDEAGAAEGSQ